MKAETKKFIKWLVIADLLAIVVVIILGAIFIKNNHYQRGRMLGQGIAQFLIFSNISAALIRHGWRSRKHKKEKQ